MRALAFNVVSLCPSSRVPHRNRALRTVRWVALVDVPYMPSLGLAGTKLEDAGYKSQGIVSDPHTSVNTLRLRG